jgi:hypothetical protein
MWSLSLLDIINVKLSLLESDHLDAVASQGHLPFLCYPVTARHLAHSTGLSITCLPN